MLGTIRVISRMSRTEMVTRVAVSRLRKSLVFLFLMTMTRKRMLRKMARKERADQEIQYHVWPGITLINMNMIREERRENYVNSVLPQFPAESKPDSWVHFLP